MSDKTFGVKVNEDLYDKVKLLIEQSGDSAKDWFEKVVNLAEIQSIKEGSKDYSQDLNELEIHTARIYELVSNMIQRAIYIKDNAVKEVSDKLEHSETIISEYKEKVNSSLEKVKQIEEENKQLEHDNKELIKQIEDHRITHKNNQSLIKEYKEKVETLSGLIAKYNEFAKENEKLQSQINELNQTINDLREENKNLQLHNQNLKERHEVELERISEKKDYERESSLLKLERDYQQKILSMNEKYSEEINNLYQKINAMHVEYEEKLEDWKKEFIKNNTKGNN